MACLKRCVKCKRITGFRHCPNCGGDAYPLSPDQLAALEPKAAKAAKE